MDVYKAFRFTIVNRYCLLNMEGLLKWFPLPQGYNARKVRSELSLGGNVNTRRMSQPDMGSIFHIKKSMKYSGHRKLLSELSKFSKFNAFNLLGYLTNTDASILVYKFRPKRTGFNMYAKYTQLQLTFLAL